MPVVWAWLYVVTDKSGAAGALGRTGGSSLSRDIFRVRRFSARLFLGGSTLAVVRFLAGDAQGCFIPA
jgi:hypothetical protein